MGPEDAGDEAGASDNAAQIASLQPITCDEFMRNTGENGGKLWIVVDSIVFDVTKYQMKHPGGPMPLKKVKDCDGTEGFAKFHGKKGTFVPLLRRCKELAIGRMSKEEYAKVPGMFVIEKEDENAVMRKFREIFGHPK